MASNDLDCKIFLETTLEREALAKLVAEAVSGTAAVARTVRTPRGDLDVRSNEDADVTRASEFPEGFLFFRYALEYYPGPAAALKERVALVTALLHFLWSQGIPAVAACDYEDDLPFRGGYNDRSVPWLSQELLPR